MNKITYPDIDWEQIQETSPKALAWFRVFLFDNNIQDHNLSEVNKRSYEILQYFESRGVIYTTGHGSNFKCYELHHEGELITEGLFFETTADALADGIKKGFALIEPGVEVNDGSFKKAAQDFTDSYQNALKGNGNFK